MMRTNLGLILAAVMTAGSNIAKDIRGPDWAVAQVKRMARKQRNRKQHRAACRRNGGRKS